MRGVTLDHLFAVFACVFARSYRSGGEEKTVQPFNGQDVTRWVLRRQEGSSWVAGVATLNPDEPRELVVGPPGEGGGQRHFSLG